MACGVYPLLPLDLMTYLTGEELATHDLKNYSTSALSHGSE